MGVDHVVYYTVGFVNIFGWVDIAADKISSVDCSDVGCIGSDCTVACKSGFDWITVETVDCAGSGSNGSAANWFGYSLVPVFDYSEALEVYWHL